MEYYFPKALKQLVAEFSKLPSIGEKSALRLAYHVISKKPEQAVSLAKSLVQAVEQVTFCERCFFLAESESCIFCRNDKRNPEVICVVEKPMDVMAIERTGEFFGLYHVLHGVWAPMRGMGPEEMKFAELIKRIQTEDVKELILATSSTVEGDATSLYISEHVSDYDIPCTRLAQGMPKGGDLEYMDDMTLSRALTNRLQL